MYAKDEEYGLEIEQELFEEYQMYSDKADYKELLDFFEKDCLLDTECFIRIYELIKKVVLKTIIYGWSNGFCERNVANGYLI